MKRLSPQQVLFIHSRLAGEKGPIRAVRDLDYLDSACDRPYVSFNGFELFPDLVAKAACLLHALIDYHPFLHGNRQVAVAAAIMFLEMNGVELITTPESWQEVAGRIAAGETGVTETTRWLKNQLARR